LPERVGAGKRGASFFLCRSESAMPVCYARFCIKILLPKKRMLQKHQKNTIKRQINKIDYKTDSNRLTKVLLTL
jgi:hypothetical protein